MSRPKVSHEIDDYGEGSSQDDAPQERPEIPDRDVEPGLQMPTSTPPREQVKRVINPWKGWRSPASNPRPSEKRN